MRGSLVDETANLAAGGFDGQAIITRASRRRGKSPEHGATEKQNVKVHFEGEKKMLWPLIFGNYLLPYVQLYLK